MPVAREVASEEIVRRILAVGAPDAIVLFGSHAREDFRPSSDYDVLIIQRSDKPRYSRSGVYYRALSELPVEVDIVVFTPEEVQEWQFVPQAFITTALREGRILYERQVGTCSRLAQKS